MATALLELYKLVELLVLVENQKIQDLHSYSFFHVFFAASEKTLLIEHVVSRSIWPCIKIIHTVIVVATKTGFYYIPNLKYNKKIIFMGMQ